MLGLTREEPGPPGAQHGEHTGGPGHQVKHLVTVEAEADHQARAAVALDRL